MSKVRIFDRRFKFGERFLPRIGKSNKLARNKLQNLKNVKLLPELPDGEAHPCPYYRTDDALPELLHPPWKDDSEREEQEAFQELIEDPRNAKFFTDAILRETVDEEIMAIASAVLSKIKHKQSRDEKSFEIMEGEILVPTIQREVFVSVWELLYEWGRDLTRQEFKELDKRKHELRMDPSAIDALTEHMFEGKGWSDDLSDEKTLSANRWDVLLYNYNVKLHQNSFKHNVALHLLQERIITNVASDAVLEEVVEILEHDMVHLDKHEKTDNPPRIG